MFLQPSFDRLSVNQDSWESVIQFWAKGNWYFFTKVCCLLFLFVVAISLRKMHLGISFYIRSNWPQLLNVAQLEVSFKSTCPVLWLDHTPIHHTFLLLAIGGLPKEGAKCGTGVTVSTTFCEMSSQWILVYRESWPTRKHGMSRDTRAKKQHCFSLSQNFKVDTSDR